MAQPARATDTEPVRGNPQAPRDARDRLIVALDVPTLAQAEHLVDRLGEAVSFYKIGMQLVFAGGLDLIPRLRAAGKRVFLDMKLLDIDNTVANGAHNIANLDVNLTTIHAYPKAMRAAIAACADTDMALLAVTVLTSMDDGDLAAAGYAGDAPSLVAARAADAVAAGMGGIVCSPAEAARVRSIVGSSMLIVTPGIRPQGAASGDQKRVATPSDAIAAGADYCVVGRPVSAAENPGRAAEAIVAEIAASL